MRTIKYEGLQDCWYIFDYYKYRKHDDFLSRQLMDFKADYPKSIQAFATIAAEKFTTAQITFDFVIRVLGSKELFAKRPNRVSDIARSISHVTSARYIPQLIRKTRVTRELKFLDKDTRKTELAGVYEIQQHYDLNDKRVLIVDDISTFGTSFEAIAEVILKAYPGTLLFGFSLAKNEDYGSIELNKNHPELVAEYRNALSRTY